MAQYIEDFLPPIQSVGLNTAENTSLGGTLVVTGAVTLSGSTTTGTGAIVALSATSAGVSGGLQTPGISFGNTTSPLGWYSGAGVPTIAAYQGSIYTNVAADAPDYTRLYVRSTTSWINVNKMSILQ